MELKRMNNHHEKYNKAQGDDIDVRPLQQQQLSASKRRRDQNDDEDNDEDPTNPPILHLPIVFPRLHDNLPRWGKEGRMTKHRLHRWKLRKLVQECALKGVIQKDDQDQRHPRVVVVKDEKGHSDMSGTTIFSETNNDGDSDYGATLLPLPLPSTDTTWNDTEDVYRDVLIAAMETAGRQDTAASGTPHVVPT